MFVRCLIKNINEYRICNNVPISVIPNFTNPNTEIRDAYTVIYFNESKVHFSECVAKLHGYEHYIECDWSYPDMDIDYSRKIIKNHSYRF